MPSRDNTPLASLWQIRLSMIGFVLLWNSGFIAAEYGIASTGAFTLLFWRYLFLTLALAPFVYFRGKTRHYNQKTILQTMLIGVLSHGVWLSCAVLSIQLGVPAGIVALIVALQPLLTGVLAGAWLGEAPGKLQWLGLFLGLAGVVITVTVRINSPESTPLLGYFLPFGAVIAMTLASLMQRSIHLAADAPSIPLLPMLFYQSLATTSALIIPAITLESMAIVWDHQLIYALLWLIFVVSLGAYMLMWTLIAWTDATRVAGLFYLGPPVTAFMGWLAFRDQLLITDIAGLTLAGLGAWLAQHTQRAKPPHTPSP